MWTGRLGVLFLLATSFVLQAESRKSRKYGKKCKKIMKFLHVSDIHLDPFYNQSMDKDTYCHKSNGSKTTADYKAPYGRIGCDSPEWLWESTLRAMKSKGADFMLLTGDSAAHGMTDTQGSHKVLHAMSLVSSKAHEMFPEIPIFPCFGNNDLPGHYILPNSSEWYETVLSYWSPLILCSKCPPNVTKTTTPEKLKKTFLNGGYYSANIASKLSVESTTFFLEIAPDFFLYCKLLENLEQGDPFDFSYFWISKYTKRFVNIVGKFHTIIAGQFYAHTHKHDFRLQILNSTGAATEEKSSKSFALQTASVSPVYSNNPAFKVFKLNTMKKAVLDYDQFYLDLVVATEFLNPVWQFDYTFSKKFPSKRKVIDAERIDELNQQLISQTDGRFWNSYIKGTTANYQTGRYDRFPLYCVMRYVFKEDFEKCREKLKVLGG
ncbi:PREDICTED: acid sphingomyelinase-like phosphodiesterase 3a [Acropora digitifera]|uniref:acid sphingomyelinase-like phosphodiesterase 3a n=1 Tax=Acropora digitifera TaxID=70779 RepID=UPI00077AE844|nr:PREDICTED: acid sphingomyelinase-like phosphodiesterase 3a [Acropora digitifera]